MRRVVSAFVHIRPNRERQNLNLDDLDEPLFGHCDWVRVKIDFILHGKTIIPVLDA
jgi:hypothetical protein